MSLVCLLLICLIVVKPFKGSTVAGKFREELVVENNEKTINL